MPSTRSAPQRTCDTREHPAGPHGAAEHVEATLRLPQNLAADLHVAVESVGAGVTLPPSLGTRRKSAPKADIVNSFSFANASDERRTNG